MKIGEYVRILSGPYFGRSGMLTRIRHGRYIVHLDRAIPGTLGPRVAFKRGEIESTGKFARWKKRSQPT